MKKLLVVGALFLAVAPALANAGTTSVAANASKHCTSLRTQIGATAFGKTFSSFGACVSSVTPLERLNASTASASCLAERADASFAATHGGKTFARFYGKGAKGAHALANCISRKTASSSAAERNASVGTSTTCTSGVKPYGEVEPNDSMTACTSSAAHALIAAQIAAAPSCVSARVDPGFAAAHGGKTFAQWYGTTSDMANAFGKCVVSKTLVPSAQLPTQTTTTPSQSGTTTTTGPSGCDPAGTGGGIPHTERPAVCVA